MLSKTITFLRTLKLTTLCASVALCGALGCSAASTGAPTDAQDSAELIQKGPATEDFTVVLDDVTLEGRRTIASPYAPTLIVVNGGPGLSRTYGESLEKLAGENLRVVTFNQRGMASSSTPTNDDYSIDAYVRDIEGVRKALGVERAFVLGHSFGGLLSMAYAIAHPDRVEGLLLVSSAPPSLEELSQATARFQQRFDGLVATGVVPPAPPAVVGDDCTAYNRYLLPAYFSDPHHALTADLVSTTCNRRVQASTYRDFGNFDLRPLLKNLAVRTAIFFGENDPLGVGMGEAIRAAMTSRPPSFQTFPACGHYAWHECGDQLLPALAAFIAR